MPKSPPLSTGSNGAAGAMANLSSSAGGAPYDDSRIRFLRACDRCRVRKIKCGHENPCAKCVSAKVICSFSTKVGNSRTVLSSVEPKVETRDEPSSTATDMTGKRLLSSDDSAARKRRVLDSDQTAHFYVSSHGLSHHAGSTSGLPLLEATRLLATGRAASSKGKQAEPDWQWLQDLLHEGPSSAPNSDEASFGDYFPGRDVARSKSAEHLVSTITEIIPPDLMSDLLRIFFTTIHPVWPIIHIPSFFNDFNQWDDHAFAALVVSMCMLASRYTSDPRARTDPDNPASSGLHLSSLFNRLLDRAIASDNVIYAIQSRFFASQFQSVDNVPHPVAQGLFAEALSRTLDGGLQRTVSPSVMGSSILREIRSRTAWAVYVWDKQISTFCGRPHLMQMWDMDVRLPEPFEEDDKMLPPREHIYDNDVANVETFRQLIQVSAVLESAFRASSHRPIVPNCDFMNEVSRQTRPDDDDAERLEKTMASLDKWRRNTLPEIAEPVAKSRATMPGYSMATEQVASVDHMVQLLVASRYLQLETLSSDPQAEKLERFRVMLINSGRELVSLVVQLGATSQLGRGDILIAYRLLFTGRLLLACVLSARAVGNDIQSEEATKILHAASTILRHFVSQFPVALGSAEVLDETTRVCRVPQASSRSPPRNASRFAWYRPLVHQTNTSSAAQRAVIEHSDSPNRIAESSTRSTGPPVFPAIPHSGMSPIDATFFRLGNVPTLSLFQSLDNFRGATDFSWLLPGADGNINLPYYFPTDNE